MEKWQRGGIRAWRRYNLIIIGEQSRCDYQDRSQYAYLKNMMMSRVWGAKSPSSLSSRKKSRSEF